MERDWSPTIGALHAGLAEVVRGNPEAIELLLVGVLAGGHVLLEDIPGVGKTTLAKALARIFQVDFSRVQFTPDLLPADILGAPILNPQDGSIRFRPGPIFANVLLADEINRASPRTQSALLEAMNESQVSVEGESHALPRPFCVLATQNPSDYQGTYPLPEAQLDRFLLRFGLGHPDFEDELEVLFAHQARDPIEALLPVASADELVAMQQQVRESLVKREVAEYLLRLVEATRDHRQLALGISTRGALALFRAGQARAFLQGRAFVSPDDLQQLASPVLAHRVQLGSDARYGGETAEVIISDIVAKVPVPV
jgi:MoxR-like ATPase